MKNTYKYLISLALAVCMLLTIAACGESKPDQNTEQNTEQQTEQTEAPVILTETAPEGVAIGTIAAAATPVERFATHPALLLWESDVPGAPAVAPTLIPYLTEEAKGTIILLQGIDAQGSGYYISEGAPVAEHLNGLGYDVFICKYRITQSFSDDVTGDVRRAVRFVNFYSEEFGLGTQRIALMGFGTGGLLSFIEDCDNEIGKSAEGIDAMSAEVRATIMVNTDIKVTEGMFAGAAPQNTPNRKHYFGVFYEQGSPDVSELMMYFHDLKNDAFFGSGGTIEYHSIIGVDGYEAGGNRTVEYDSMYDMLVNFLEEYIF